MCLLFVSVKLHHGELWQQVIDLKKKKKILKNTWETSLLIQDDTIQLIQ